MPTDLCKGHSTVVTYVSDDLRVIGVFCNDCQTYTEQAICQ